MFCMVLCIPASRGDNHGDWCAGTGSVYTVLVTYSNHTNVLLKLPSRACIHCCSHGTSVPSALGRYTDDVLDKSSR